MFPNQSGITKVEYKNDTQILIDPRLYFGVGVKVAQSAGTTVGSKKIAKAGTPLAVDLTKRDTAATKGVATSSSTTVTAVLVHDVDVTDGVANGTACIFGFLNIARMETDVQALYTADMVEALREKNITCLKQS